MFKLVKKQNNDYVLILIAVLLLILVGGVILSSSFKKDRNAARHGLPLKIIGKANLTIDFGEKGRRAFEGDIVENETLIDILNQSARAGGFSFKLNDKSDIAFIGEFSTGGKKSWHWYLNGEEINKKPNEVIAKPGDKILIKYE